MTKTEFVAPCVSHLKKDASFQQLRKWVAGATGLLLINKFNGCDRFRPHLNPCDLLGNLRGVSHLFASRRV